MTEFALVAPVLIFLLFSVVEGGLVMFSVGSARLAAGEAARQLSESGNASNADALTLQVIRNTPLATTRLATVDHVDIYHLTEQSNGTLTVDAAKYNSYQLDGTPIGATTWPSSSRDVINGQTDFIGVTIYYHYTWKTGALISASPLSLQQAFYVRLEPQTY